MKNLDDFGTIFQKQIDYIQTKMKNIELTKTHGLKSELEITNNNSEYEIDYGESIKNYQNYLNDIKEKITINEN